MFTAVDGFDALSKIADHRPDIIFVDIMMPRLDGYQTCSLIKHNKSIQGHAGHHAVQQGRPVRPGSGRLVGSEQYLTKPFTKDELLGAIVATWSSVRGRYSVWRLIMIVDDSPTEVHVLKTALEKHGFDTVSAADGSECLSLAREVRPDLIFMDVVMPRVNGYQATRTLTRDPQTKSIPVVMITTKDQETRSHLGHASGRRRLPRQAGHGGRARRQGPGGPGTQRRAERLNLQALVDQPFELLAGTRAPRTRGDCRARRRAGCVRRMGRHRFRLGAERFVAARARHPRGAAGPGTGHPRPGCEAVAARHREPPRSAAHRRGSEVVPRRR